MCLNFGEKTPRTFSLTYLLYILDKNLTNICFRKPNNGVLYADYHAISRFFTTGQSFEILSVKSTKKAILTYFGVPLNSNI